MAQHVIGLDVGSWSIKAAVLESGLRKFSLDAFSEYVLPNDEHGLPSETVAESVRTALEGIQERSQVILTAVPGSRAMIRDLELPFDDDKRVRSVLPFEMDGELPIPVEELTFDYAQVDKTEGGGAKLIVGAVSSQWLGEFLGELKDAGADPKSVGLDTMAYAALVPRLAEAGSLGITEDIVDTDIAFIDLGHQSSGLCVVHDGKPVTVRSLARGGRQVTQALSDALQVPYAEAERIKHAEVRLDGHTPVGVDEATHQRRVAVVGEALGPIVRDLRLALHAHMSRTGRRVGKAFVFGGTARLPGLVDMLGEALGVPTQIPRISKMAWAKVDGGDGIDLSAVKATALALRHATDAGVPQLNFRQADHAYESDFKAFRDRAWWLATLGILLVGVLLTRQYMARDRLETQKAALVEELRRFSKATLGKEMTNFDQVLTKVATAKGDAADELFPKLTAFKAFYLVTEAQDQTNAMMLADAVKAPGPPTPKPPQADKDKDKDGEKDGDEEKDGDGDEEKEEPKPRYRVEFNSVNVDTEKATIRGEVNDVEALAEFEGRLKKQKCFREVNRTDTKNSRKPERGTWKEFTVQIKIQCTDPAEAAKKKKKPASKSKAKGDK